MSSIKMIIGADIVPTISNMEHFESGNVEKLIGKELQDILASAKYRVFNLEVPLTNQSAPIIKQGPHLKASEASVAGLSAMGIDLLTLANNHILDHDQQGLQSTCRILEESNIAYVGVGRNVQDAAAPHITEIDGKKIGIYTCVENEFSIATDVLPGANPYDPLEIFDHVAELKKTCDYVIVLYHGGKEHYRYPSPELQRVCRKLVRSGADLVLCQHTHCVGCEEEYMGSTIVYGQGNFLFDYSESEFWQTSLLVTVDDDFRVGYIPVVKEKETVRLATGEAAEKIMADFRTRGIEIQQDGFIQEQYAKFAESMLKNYYLSVTGIKWKLSQRIRVKLSKILGIKLDNVKINKRVMLAVENFAACEAHRELLLCGVRKVCRKSGK